LLFVIVVFFVGLLEAAEEFLESELAEWVFVGGDLVAGGRESGLGDDVVE
jgi:hypothetical protein